MSGVASSIADAREHARERVEVDATVSEEKATLSSVPVHRTTQHPVNTWIHVDTHAVSSNYTAGMIDLNT